MIRVFVVEDDASAAERLCNYINQYAADNKLELQIECFPDGQSFCDVYNGQADVVFMDVQMPRMDGFLAARAVRAIDPTVPILFLTNAAQYAIHGYEVDAVDYIIKPLLYEAFCMKFEKVLRLLITHQCQSIMLCRRGENRLLKTNRIYYVESYNHQLCYHTVDGDFSQTGAGLSLQKLEQDLASGGFARCHNCYLVNLQYVDRMENDSIWITGHELPIGRTRKKAFTQALMGHYRGKRP